MDTQQGEGERTACAQRDRRGKTTQGSKAEEQSEVEEKTRGREGRKEEKKKKVDSVTAREKQTTLGDDDFPCLR